MYKNHRRSIRREIMIKNPLEKISLINQLELAMYRQIWLLFPSAFLTLEDIFMMLKLCYISSHVPPLDTNQKLLLAVSLNEQPPF